MGCMAAYKRGDIIEAKPVIMSLRGEHAESNTSKTRVQGGYRPFLIVGEKVTSNHPLLVVCAITKRRRGNYPFVQEIMLTHKSYIHYEQIFTIDKKDYRYVRSLYEFERREMELKSNFCIGGSKNNILNIEGVELLKEEYDSYIGVVRYQLGEDADFKLPKIAYRNRFGAGDAAGDVESLLSTVAGIQLILQEGGITN